EACGKFTALCQRRTDLFSWRSGVNERALRSSSGSDMSLDDQTHDHHHNGSHQADPNQSKPSTFQPQQPKSLSSSTFPLRRALRESSVESDDSSTSTSTKEQTETNSETTKKDEESPPSIAATQPARRLSVQDRINMFENKQKENSSSSGGKPVVGKPAELRRLSSDVSAASAVVEKAVLRRWSGVSDMSISVDLSGDKKEIESSESTPTPTFASIHAKVGAFAASYGDKDRKASGFKDSGSKSQIEQLGSDSKLTSSLGKVENVGLKDQSSSATRSNLLPSRTENMDLKGQANSQPQFKSFSRGEELFDSRDQVPFQAQGKISSGRADHWKSKDQTSSETQLKGFLESAEGGVSASSSGDRFDGETNQSKVENVGMRDQFVPKSRFKSSLPKTEDVMSSGKESIGAGTKKREASLPQSEVVESGTHLPQWRSSIGEVEEVGRKDIVEMLPFSPSTKVEDSGLQGMKLQQQGSVEVKKLQVRRDDSGSFSKNKTAFPVSESKDIFNVTTAALAEQSQRIRQSKGNQELNDELQMKANELEKLFAEHKLRVPSDQSVTSWRGKPVDVVEVFGGSENKKAAADGIHAQIPDEITVVETIGSYSSASNLNAGSQKRLVYNLDHGSNMKQNYSELGLSDDFRGKFYDKYMQKRDAKLKEEWDSKRAEKEAKLKAMHDSLERSRAEMKAKFSGSAGRRNSAQSALSRGEKLRSFNNHPPVKREEFVDFLQSGEDEDLSKFPESKPYGQDRLFGETSLGDGSRSSNLKKVLPSRNISSATPRTPAAPAPRSAAKTSNTGSGRRRMQSENPLAQSVPNFSDLKKENMKPSSGGCKSTTHTQSRHYARSKSSSEDARVKEEKLRRPPSLRKSSPGPVESKDVSNPNSDGVVLAPLKFDREQTEPGVNDKLSKNMESKTFLRKGNGTGPGAGAGIAKLKASVASEAVKNEEESDKLAFESEEVADIGKQVEEEEEAEEEEEDDDEEEFESVAAEDFDNVDNGNPRLSQESGNSGSDNGDTIRSHSHVDSSLEAELPAALPSTYHSAGPVQESPGESPISWNSHMHHSFSYPQETSDVDASADSPIGSPASWNSHSLAQTEADAARMRKKWGSAQKPILISNTSQNPSRKDVTKGFKRLLKFGRKNRGTESLVDWISATTSEGDDDIEDGRDPANRSSEDLRKSRMGFSQSHPSDDGFNDSELFSEQVQAMNSSIPAPPASFKLREDQFSGSSI
ncbi:hypothetical protein RJ641_019767, partial [Dillenia turbinata]